jgi:hypothetical protein
MNKPLVGIGGIVAALGGAAALIMGPSGGLSPDKEKGDSKMSEVKATITKEGINSPIATWALQDVQIGEVAYIYPKLDEPLLVVMKDVPEQMDKVGVYNLEKKEVQWLSTNAIVGSHRYWLTVFHIKVQGW